VKRRDAEKIRQILQRSEGIPRFIRRVLAWEFLREHERSIIQEELERIEQLRLGLDLSIQMENDEQAPFMAFELIFSLDYALQVIDRIVRCFDFRDFRFPEEDDEGEEWKRGYQDG